MEMCKKCYAKEGKPILCNNCEKIIEQSIDHLGEILDKLKK